MPTQTKKTKVKNFTDKLDRAKAVYLTNYQGMPHKKLEEVRKKIKKEKADYTIIKNSLFQLALTQSQQKAKVESQEIVKGPTAVLFAYDDELKPLQTFVACFDSIKDRIKAALAFGEVFVGKKLNQLIKLESVDKIEKKLILNLNSPFYKLTRALIWNQINLIAVLNQIKKKKEAEN